MRVNKLFCVAVLFAIFVFVSALALEDEQREFSRYCKNVHGGLWPDFHSIGPEACREVLK